MKTPSFHPALASKPQSEACDLATSEQQWEAEGGRQHTLSVWHPPHPWPPFIPLLSLASAPALDQEQRISLPEWLRHASSAASPGCWQTQIFIPPTAPPLLPRPLRIYQCHPTPQTPAAWTYWLTRQVSRIHLSTNVFYYWWLTINQSSDALGWKPSKMVRKPEQDRKIGGRRNSPRQTVNLYLDKWLQIAVKQSKINNRAGSGPPGAGVGFEQPIGMSRIQRVG